MSIAFLQVEFPDNSLFVCILEFLARKLVLYDFLAYFSMNADNIMPSSFAYYTVCMENNNNTNCFGFSADVMIRLNPPYEDPRGSPMRGKNQVRDVIYFFRDCLDEEQVKYIFTNSWISSIMILGVITFCHPRIMFYMHRDDTFPSICKTGFILNVFDVYPDQELFTHMKNIDLGIPVFCNIKIVWHVANPFVIDVQTGRGIQVNMFNTMQGSWNIHVEYEEKEEFQQELLNNGTYEELVEYLVDGKADVGLGRLMMNDTETIPCTLGVVFYNDELRFAAPKPKVLVSVTKLIIIFEKEVWLTILYTLIAIIVSIYVISRALSIRHYGLMRIIFSVCGMSIGTGMTSKSDKISLRIIVIACLLFSLNMDNIYLGKLSSTFTAKTYDVKTDSLYQLGIKNLRQNISYHIDRLLKIKFVVRHDPVISRAIHLMNRSDDDLMQEVARLQDNGTCTFRSTLDANAYDKSRLDTFAPQYVYLSLYETFYVSRSTLLSPMLIEGAQWMFDSGFIVKWWNDVVLNTTKFFPPYEPENKLVKLSLEHYTELAYIYFYGCVAALVVFLLEFPARWVEINTRLIPSIKYLFRLLKPPVEK